MITFLKIKPKMKCGVVYNGGGFTVEYSKDNNWPEEMDVTEEMGLLILSAQRAARNELRRRFAHAFETERER